MCMCVSVNAKIPDSIKKLSIIIKSRIIRTPMPAGVFSSMRVFRYNRQQNQVFLHFLLENSLNLHILPRRR